MLPSQEACALQYYFLILWRILGLLPPSKRYMNQLATNSPEMSEWDILHTLRWSSRLRIPSYVTWIKVPGNVASGWLCSVFWDPDKLGVRPWNGSEPLRLLRVAGMMMEEAAGCEQFPPGCVHVCVRPSLERSTFSVVNPVVAYLFSHALRLLVFCPGFRLGSPRQAGHEI